MNFRGQKMSSSDYRKCKNSTSEIDSPNYCSLSHHSILAVTFKSFRPRTQNFSTHPFLLSLVAKMRRGSKGDHDNGFHTFRDFLFNFECQR